MEGGGTWVKKLVAMTPFGAEYFSAEAGKQLRPKLQKKARKLLTHLQTFITRIPGSRIGPVAAPRFHA